jgi:hypothetical protein
MQKHTAKIEQSALDYVSLLAHARMIRNHLIEDAQARAEFDAGRVRVCFNALMVKMGVRIV